jgi:hypothetical protein
MKVIIQKFLIEPAVAIGAIVTVALFGVDIASVGLDGLTTGDVMENLAPLAASLGIRPLVSPVAGADQFDVERLLDEEQRRIGFSDGDDEPTAGP